MFSSKILDPSLSQGIPKEFKKLRNKKFDDWEIPPWDLIIYDDKLLGEGKFGKVYLASWKKTIVVAKVITIKNKNELYLRELKIMMKSHHPNIVQFYGFVEDPFIIVMEYMPKNDLLHYITNKNISKKKKINICIDILKGLNYLHNRKPFYIIHRDIKPQNILISESGTAKITDFGLGKILNGNQKEIKSSIDNLTELVNFDSINNDLTFPVGTRRYMSPEITSEQFYSSKIDIWSVGIMFAELFENKRYSEDFSWLKTPNDVKELIVKYMIRNNPLERLNANELIDLFNQILNKYKNRNCFCSIFTKIIS